MEMMRARTKRENSVAELVELLMDYQNGGCDSNHYVRRFYRCYIDGSYTGAYTYERNKRLVETKKDNPEMLAKFAIDNFLQFCNAESHINLDYHFNMSDIELALHEGLGDEIEDFVGELADDLLDLID